MIIQLSLLPVENCVELRTKDRRHHDGVSDSGKPALHQSQSEGTPAEEPVLHVNTGVELPFSPVNMVSEWFQIPWLTGGVVLVPLFMLLLSKFTFSYSLNTVRYVLFGLTNDWEPI